MFLVFWFIILAVNIFFLITFLTIEDLFKCSKEYKAFLLNEILGNPKNIDINILPILYGKKK